MYKLTVKKMSHQKVLHYEPNDGVFDYRKAISPGPFF